MSVTVSRTTRSLMRCITRDTISSISSSVMIGAGGRAAASAFAADRVANGFAVGVGAVDAAGGGGATGATGARGAIGVPSAAGTTTGATGGISATGAAGAIGAAVSFTGT